MGMRECSMIGRKDKAAVNREKVHQGFTIFVQVKKQGKTQTLKVTSWKMSFSSKSRSLGTP